MLGGGQICKERLTGKVISEQSSEDVREQGLVEELPEEASAKP